MAVKEITCPSVDERRAHGKEARKLAPPSAHSGGWTPATLYAWTCGWTLARAHARSGDPVAIAACVGSSDTFDKSIGDFSHRYADQNERDYQQFVKAIRSGRLEALENV